MCCLSKHKNKVGSHPKSLYLHMELFNGPFCVRMCGLISEKIAHTPSNTIVKALTTHYDVSIAFTFHSARETPTQSFLLDSYTNSQTYLS